MIYQNINKSKKKIKCNENKSKKLPIKKKHNTYIKNQKGGTNTYNITLFSNYTFHDTKNVNDKINDIYKNDGGKTTPMGKFMFKCTNFLINPDFETLYIKSNFEINNTSTNVVSRIITNQNTFSNFQSLILLEICYKLFNFINKDRILIKEDKEGKKNFFHDYQSTFRVIKKGFLNDIINLENACLFLVFPYKFLLFTMEDTNKELNKKKYSMLYNNKIPFGLVLLNYLFNNFNEQIKDIIEKINVNIYDGNNNYKINIGVNNFISLPEGETFANIKSKLDTIYNTYIIDINKKFNYSYDNNQSFKYIAEAISLTTT